MDITRASKRITALLLCAPSLMLVGCGGSSNSIQTALLPNASGAHVRFVDADSGFSGNVDVVIDGTAQFSNVALDTVTNYLSVGSGTHSVSVFPAGNDSGTAIFSNGTFSVNGSNYETIALAGGSNPQFYKVSDQVFSGTYAGFGAVSYYNFSPTSGAGGIDFGVYNNPQASITPNITTLAPTNIAVGNTTNPIAVPNGSTPFGFAAAARGTTAAIATLLPSAVDPNGCSANTFACNSGFISVFLVDGPKLIGVFNAGGQ